MLQISNQENIVIIAVTLLLVLLGMFIVSYVLVYQKRQQLNRLEKQQLQNAYQQELLNTQLEIQEQTLKIISQEIHDNIGQALTLVKLNLNTMLPVDDQKLEGKIIDSKVLVGKAIADLRDLSHSMDTDYIKEMGLQRAIEYELERIQKLGIVNAIMELQGNAGRLPKQKELILFRITQEALNNTLKHAAAKTIKVLMKYSGSGLELTIADDGKGLSSFAMKSNGAGLGIRNMQSRAQMIGGTFSIIAAPDNGTTVNVFLPIENNP